LKLVRNNPDKRKINKREPKPKGGPVAPAELDARGKREWKRITKALYCAAFSTWRKAQKEIKKGGRVVKAANKTPIPSPWLAVANKDLDQIIKFDGELELTLSARTRAHIAMPAASSWRRLGRPIAWHGNI
jgi:P27 family predicted phage terminase small subunit